MTKQLHPFHIVNISPWPLLSSISALISVGGLVLALNNHTTKIMLIGVLSLMITAMAWWRDVIRESTFQGHHPMNVVAGLKWGMILFITSEIMFFLSFFWAFFHSSLTPGTELTEWPPTAITSFNPMHTPLLNSAILLASGVSLTWAHHSIINNHLLHAEQALTMTVLQGILFSIIQFSEYQTAPFSISDSVYGSTFFMATGFHGIHVLIGSIFLTVAVVRLFYKQYTNKHHFGFEAAAWYWHFVDVVWLFLYLSIYWWGG